MRSSDGFRLFTSWLFLPQGDVCDLLRVDRPAERDRPIYAAGQLFSLVVITQIRGYPGL
jgi:hypothetical protein